MIRRPPRSTRTDTRIPYTTRFRSDLLTKFEKDTGIKVTLDVYDSNETMLAKLQAGAAGYDVVVPSDYMVKIMIEEGLAEKIDARQMENFKNVTAPHNNQPLDRKSTRLNSSH